MFDGHPHCHVHPYEWHFGSRRRFEWPTLRPEAPPEQWWIRLREEELDRRFVSGIRGNPTKYRGKDVLPRGLVYPLLLPPLLHRRLFLEAVKDKKEIRGDRDILNAYLTGLFNAWLNNHALEDPDKRWVVAFAPRLAWGESRESFFGAYPDGRLISILRDPLSWMASARGRQVIKGEHDTERLIAMWKRSTWEMIEAKNERGKVVSIVRFDDLVRTTGGVMRMLSRTMKIKFTEGLTVPTFNMRPIGANSSYPVGAKQGVISEPLTRHKSVLSKEDVRLISEQCDALHDEALRLADRPRRSAKAKEARPATRPTSPSPPPT